MGKVRWKVDSNDDVKEIHKVVVHRFSMGDVDDPDLYAAQPMWEWQNSDPGKFVMEYAEATPEWYKNHDPLNWGYEFAIVAELEVKKLSEFYLRWGNQSGNLKTRT